MHFLPSSFQSTTKSLEAIDPSIHPARVRRNRNFAVASPIGSSFVMKEQTSKPSCARQAFEDYVTEKLPNGHALDRPSHQEPHFVAPKV